MEGINYSSSPLGSHALPVENLLAEINGELERALGPLGLQAGQCAVLRLMRQNAALRQAEIAERLGFSRQVTARLVNQLCERLLLQRVPNPRRKNQMLLRLSPIGEALLHRAEQRIAVLERGLAARFAPGEAHSALNQAMQRAD